MTEVINKNLQVNGTVNANDTISNNIAFGVEKNSIDLHRINIILQQVQLDKFVNNLEDGLNTKVGERGVQISGGQRQRIGIARALYNNPEILILDEATSNLDNESESLIQESLKTLMKGRTTFVIAHRLSTIRQADQIFVIENGEIVEKGTHEKLLSLEGRYYKLHKYQARI